MNDAQLLEAFEEEFGLVPKKWEICGTCRGNGTHVNRAIDGNGLDPNDPDLDEEFWDMYRSGGYDVRCEEGCRDGKIQVLDEDRASPDVVQAWHEWQKDALDLAAEYAAERRMGA